MVLFFWFTGTYMLSNRFEVKSTPAIVILKDPGVKPVVYHDCRQQAHNIALCSSASLLQNKKSIAGKKARDSKTLLHHSGSKPFSYRVEARREEGSKFPQIDLFKHVYVHPNNENSDQLYGDMVEKSIAILQEATSQLPPETPIEDVIVPKDADVQIVTEVLDQKFGRRHGKVVRYTGKAGVRETGAFSSRLSTGEVNSLKEEVTTLRGQVAAQDDHIRAQDERMNMIVQALAMSGLQIPTMLAPNVAPPSTSQPFHPNDTE
ncbi:uncharacterized protein LOC126584411 [Malus sylvestris]|uniref:uncharacterized protein LOC126584411 n=1 Tax=Malus sylvestris TaxID=3752 RepID=UPI0021ACF949|nr:uncharacterized protein LOC126584411 [Malus sylvestris]